MTRVLSDAHEADAPEYQFTVNVDVPPVQFAVSVTATPFVVVGLIGASVGVVSALLTIISLLMLFAVCGVADESAT